ncbi:tyrosine-type recombinase/integrase [Halalkalibacter urbisdiaboli]|uniref:tyrosine-type recombinase/integrase n=1 Tax=Halalkalibacter urbisdiaboli TaxID=1960589 RepID=UPI001FDAB71E|nr:tyrosine-type recombinase/integrase [Halalkalibacter urbisdiaboli]
MALKGKASFKRPKMKKGTRKYAGGKFNGNAVKKFAMSQLFDKFMVIKKTEGLARKTLADYVTHYDWFCDFLEVNEGVRDLLHEEITSEPFLDYVQFMQEKGLMNSTINIRIRTLRAFLRWCHSEEYIDEAIHVKFKPVKQPNEQIDALTPDELQRILSVIDDTKYVGFRDITMILVSVDSMVRISELLSIKRENVDVKNASITLEPDSTKNRKGRTVPLSNRTLRYLNEYLAEIEDFYDEHLFLTYDGRPLEASSFRWILKEYGNAAGVTNKRVSPHTLRHTGALFYILNGGDPFSLMRILGHSDITMTRRYVNMATSNVTVQHNKFSPLKQLFDK